MENEIGLDDPVVGMLGEFLDDTNGFHMKWEALDENSMKNIINGVTMSAGIIISSQKKHPYCNENVSDSAEIAEALIQEANEMLEYTE